jgi:hypothetical protein
MKTAILSSKSEADSGREGFEPSMSERLFSRRANQHNFAGDYIIAFCSHLFEELFKCLVFF